MGGAPSVIQRARNHPAPPPSITPIDDPVSSHALLRPCAGPISGFASGVKVIGPFTTVLIPALPRAGMRSSAALIICSTRFRSGGNRSAPKSGGTPSTDQTLASRSYGPRMSPSRSWRTYQLSSGSRMMGSSLAALEMR